MNDKARTRICTRIDGLIIEPDSEGLLKSFWLKNHDYQINGESDDYQTQKT
jgi:hypothetical protein